MRKHRSHELVPVGDCLIAAAGAESPSPLETVAAAGSSHDFAVAQDGFWQVHPGAPQVLVESVLDLLDPQPGERVLDLYAGVGPTALDEPFDLVVLDPPREGARGKVVSQVADRSPRAVAYVACDPAALARDVATFAGLGYSLTALRAFDLFPMTHHVECVALLTRA
jgi:tRNA/tmRNA/rRNA uracil-C5-methylase (TrmA/RlmC/RlmD family)